MHKSWTNRQGKRWTSMNESKAKETEIELSKCIVSNDKVAKMNYLNEMLLQPKTM